MDDCLFGLAMARYKVGCYGTGAMARLGYNLWTNDTAPGRQIGHRVSQWASLLRLGTLNTSAEDKHPFASTPKLDMIRQARKALRRAKWMEFRAPLR
jgi:hypothetical protein